MDDFSVRTPRWREATVAGPELIGQAREYDEHGGEEEGRRDDRAANSLGGVSSGS